MRKFLILAIVGSNFIFLSPGNAADSVKPPTVNAASPAEAPAPRAPIAARTGRGGATTVPASGTPLVLEAGKGTLIRLDRPAATVFVANPDVADVQVKSPSLIYVNAKAPGETVLYAVDADDNVLLNAPVRVAHDVSRLRQSLHYLMPGENIEVGSVENSLVLSGRVSTAGRAEKARTLAASVAADVKGANIVNQMAIATPNQINLRVKVAEVSRNALKVLGMNLTRTTGANFLIDTNNPTTVTGNNARNTFGALFRLPGNPNRILTTLDALTQEGLVSILAEPNLTATSGQTASFLAGGEFPVPVAVTPAGQSGTTITISFKTFGVALDFTPTIIDAEHLSLRIRPEVSALSNNGAVQVSGFTIPALTVRRAETTVELGSGETFALAGLIQHTSEQDISKVPALGDIPIIGGLFRSDRFQRAETELVILITPYLVKPSAARSVMAAPTDGLNLPHDSQRVINSKLYRQTLPGPGGVTQGAGSPGLIGPAGFRLD